MAVVAAVARMAVQGETITYRRRDDAGRLVSETVVVDAVVVPRAEEGEQDRDGRLYTRSIDVELLGDRLAFEPAEWDGVVWGGNEYTVRVLRSAQGSHHLVAVRPERREVTGDPYRRDPRTTGGAVP